jgi:hypothetical protein
MEKDRMPRFPRLLNTIVVVPTVTVILMSFSAGPVLTQTQPESQSLGTRIPDPEEAARWKKECERRADEKRFKGKKRAAIVAKCVKLGRLPPELN